MHYPENMKVETVIKNLIKFRLINLAYLLLSFISLFLGRFSKFKLIENDLWLQKQNKTFFCDYSPNYRLKGDQVDSFSKDIFFNSYQPKKGDVCIDIGVVVHIFVSCCVFFCVSLYSQLYVCDFFFIHVCGHVFFSACICICVYVFLFIFVLCLLLCVYIPVYVSFSLALCVS